MQIIVEVMLTSDACALYHLLRVALLGIFILEIGISFILQHRTDPNLLSEIE